MPKILSKSRPHLLLFPSVFLAGSIVNLIYNIAPVFPQEVCVYNDSGDLTCGPVVEKNVENKNSDSCRETVTVLFEPIKEKILADTRINGDTELLGRGDFTLKAVATNNSNGQIVINLSFDIKERVPDYTHLRGEETYRSKRIPELTNPQCFLESITPDLGKIQGSGKFGNWEWRSFSGESGLIKSALIKTDSRTKDIYKVGAKDIEFRPIQLKFSASN